MLTIDIRDDKNNAKLKNRVVSVLNTVSGVMKVGNSFVEVNLVGDDVIKTNVKSYPAPPDFPHPETPKKYLGEIYLNPDYIAKVGENFDHMLIHGFLHLLGYDHKIDADAERMEGLEEKLLIEINKNTA